MTSERVQRRIDSLLDEAETAVAETDWPLVRQRCEAVLALDPVSQRNGPVIAIPILGDLHHRYERKAA